MNCPDRCKKGKSKKDKKKKKKKVELVEWDNPSSVSACVYCWPLPSEVSRCEDRVSAPAYWFKDTLFESFQKSLHLCADGRVCSDVVDVAEVIRRC